VWVRCDSGARALQTGVGVDGQLIERGFTSVSKPQSLVQNSLAAPGGFLERHYFLFRRLHSLTGIIPVGVFLIVHLLTNSSIVWGAINTSKGTDGPSRGAATFQHEVAFIHSLPFLLLIEVFGLWLPIAFHSALGFYYATSGRSNTARYAYQSNWRYSLQRWSGYIGAIFLFYHVATLRWGWTWLPLSSGFNAEAAASTTAIALRGGVETLGWRAVVAAGFYLIGASLLVFHFANGLWTAAITWGLTVSRNAQVRWGYICAGLGVGLMAMAWSAVIGFVLLDPEKAREAERYVDSAAQESPIDADDAGNPARGDTPAAEGGSLRQSDGTPDQNPSQTPATTPR